MKNLKKQVTIFLILICAFNLNAQIAPTTGKKTLEVKQKVEGEYFKIVTIGDLSQELIDHLSKGMPKKLAKYGFTDFVIEEIGRVDETEDLIFQVNILDNITKNKFKIRLSMLAKKPQYIIKEMKVEDFADGYFCNQINKKGDKFSDTTTFTSPILNPISFVKTVTEDQTNTFININIQGLTANVGKKGVKMLLEDGKKINKPNVDIQVSVNPNGSGYLYKAFFELDEELIEILSQKSITDVRLYIYDKEIKDGFRIKEFLKCVQEK